MRFYFDYSDGRYITDARGRNCNTLGEARKVADELAEDLARKSKDTRVVVIDEAGHEVYRTPAANRPAAAAE
jgi:hypothetical protein